MHTIIVIDEGHASVRKSDRLDRTFLCELIQSERLEAALLDSPVEDATLAAYFDEEGGRRMRGENILLPSGATVRGPVVIVGLSKADGHRGLLVEELTAYDLVEKDTHFLRQLTWVAT